MTVRVMNLFVAQMRISFSIIVFSADGHRPFPLKPLSSETPNR